ncbi:hypothetical protein G6F57_005024 [Rhizopus arrhizus]|uniref:Uncharacterized protein n=1 Tax=Rhizopus oryzae TaxID=64495 RepID=A0A9P6XI95_RHIOR|nr:hypothetical protein G6F24_008092 [Rhizopus arrhizus]KAG0932714.1 hypothetical protein G6F30_010611 [Rhizopus arrhizus]KAG0976493.1 hypothetical protein G6F29_010762 [Rhizopus arrhizus]KAG0979928.1 hypothetical protein G6F28_011772 [Rhizopus arrhizus]KAG1002495.1 hypothetical protein G6F27_011908 [Rhizopus arrhizus]
MSSLQLPSFIYDNNKSKKKLSENRPELQRTASSGTLSKVKRFGSKLIRSKTQRDGSRKPPSLDFKIKDTRNSQSSLTASSTTSSLEEHVKTPTTADYDKETFNLDHPKQIITIEEQIKQEKEPMKKEEEEEKREEMMEEEMDESKLSELALIRHHLNIALKQADEEIEDELKANRENMLNTLNTFPKISFQ